LRSIRAVEGPLRQYQMRAPQTVRIRIHKSPEHTRPSLR